MLMKLHTRNKLSRSRLGNLVVLVLLAAMGVFTAIPFLFSIVQSIKPVDELFVYPPRLTVSRPTLDNFAVLFNLTSSTWVPVSRYLFNSLLLTVCGTVGNVVVCSMAAYPLAKLKFHGRKLLFNLVVVSLLFTYEVTFIPNYVILSKLQMLDTFWALLLPAVATPMGLFLMKQFMEQIPDSVVESARVDGAGDADPLLADRYAAGQARLADAGDLQLSVAVEPGGVGIYLQRGAQNVPHPSSSKWPPPAWPGRRGRGGRRHPDDPADCGLFALPVQCYRDHGQLGH